MHDRDVNVATDLFVHMRRFISAMSVGTSIREIVQIVLQVRGGTAMILDDRSNVLASCSAAETELFSPTLSAPPAMVEAAERAAQSGSEVLVETEGSRHLMICPVIYDRSLAYTIVFVRERPFDALDVEFAHHASLTVKAVVAMRHEVGQAHERARSFLLDDILSEHSSPEEVIEYRALAAGFDYFAQQAVVVAKRAEDGPKVAAAASLVARRHQGLSTHRDDSILLVVPHVDPRALAAELHDNLLPVTRRFATLGIAGPVVGREGIRMACEEAKRSRRLAESLGKSGVVVGASDLLPFSLLFSRCGEHELAEFIDASIGPLVRYDEARSSGQLVETLDVWLSFQGSVVPTAAELGIHPNTVYQRLARVDALIGPSWRKPHETMTVQLAIMFRKLSANLEVHGHVSG